MQRETRNKFKTLDARLYWDDIVSEYNSGVWTRLELKQGVRHNFANAQGEYKKDLGVMLNYL